jgi:hypothetical protein
MNPRLDLVPFHVPEEMTATGAFMGPLRHGAPTAFGLYARSPTGERVAIVPYEWPEAIPAAAGKLQRELHCVQRLEGDLSAGGAPTFRVLEVGSDPPDLVVEADAGAVGLDVTQFVLDDRAQAVAIFEKVKSEVLACPARELRHLAGHVVYVAYDRATGGLPPKNRNRSHALVAALKRFRPVRAAAQLPRKLRPETVERFTDGVISAAPLATAPRGAFYGTMGFELALSYQSTIYASQAWSRLKQRVAEHDKPEIRILLVAVGAPTVQGVAFPSDSVAARLAIERARNEALGSMFIEQIYVHAWDQGTVYLLDPKSAGVSVLCGELQPELP